MLRKSDSEDPGSDAKSCLISYYSGGGYFKHAAGNKLFQKFMAESTRCRKRHPTSIRVKLASDPVPGTPAPSTHSKSFFPGANKSRASVQVGDTSSFLPPSPHQETVMSPPRGEREDDAYYPTCGRCLRLSQENARLRDLFETCSGELGQAREHSKMILEKYLALLSQQQQLAMKKVTANAQSVALQETAAREKELLQTIVTLQNEMRLKNDELILLHTENATLKEDLHGRLELMQCLQRDYDEMVKKVSDAAAAAQVLKSKSASDDHMLHKSKQEYDLLVQELKYAKESAQSVRQIVDEVQQENQTLRSRLQRIEAEYSSPDKRSPSSPDAAEREAVPVAADCNPPASSTGEPLEPIVAALRSLQNSAAAEKSRSRTRIGRSMTADQKREAPAGRLSVERRLRQNESTIGELLKWDYGNAADKSHAKKSIQQAAMSPASVAKLRSYLGVLRKEEAQLREQRGKCERSGNVAATKRRSEIEREIEVARNNIRHVQQKLREVGVDSN